MTRWLSRSLGCAVALWFGLLMTRPELVHHCSVHDGTVAGMVAHDHMGHHAPSGDSGHSGHDHCTCPGTCCAGCAPAVSRPLGLVWVPVAAEHREQQPFVDRLVSAETDHLLPFATAPPSA